MRWQHWFFTVPLRIRSVVRRRKADQELDDELQFHLDNKIAEAYARGLTAEDAQISALRAIDGLEQRKEEMRDMRRVRWFTDFFDDLVYAARTLRRSPGVAAFVVLTLGLGIGLNVAVFSTVDAMILRPLPVSDPGQIVSISGTEPDNPAADFSYREYLELRDKTKSYSGLLAFKDMEGVGFSAEPGTAPRLKGGMLVSGNFFRVFGVEPRIGRAFRPDEDQVAGRDAVVVLAHKFWEQEFAGNLTAIGKTVRLDGVEFTVVGVAPERFTGVNNYIRPDFYIPLSMAPRLAAIGARSLLDDRSDRELNVKGRLNPGISIGQARSEITLLAKSFAREFPKISRNRGAAVYTELQYRKLSDVGDGSIATILSVLALAVLLVACTNVAGLLLTRAKTRTREIAVRLAIGAGRFRLIRLLLTESLLISAIGGLFGIAVGVLGVKLIGSYKVPTELPIIFTVQMDRRALLLSLFITLLCALLCGIAPALQSTRTDLVNGLKTSEVDLPSRKRLWGRNLLVFAQVSTSLMLLTTSFLMARDFQQAWGKGMGFSKDHLLMMSFDPRLVRYNAAQIDQFYKQLAERAATRPGVSDVALTENIPFDEVNNQSVSFVPDGFTMPPDRQTFSSSADTVSDGYFTTLGIDVLRGRAFLRTDTAKSPRVAIVNQQFANHFWPRQNPVGKRIRLDGRDGTSVEIVGVCRTIKYQWIAEPPTDFVYLPLSQSPMPNMTLLLRSRGDANALIGSIRDVVRGLDPNQPIFDVRNFADYYHNRAVEAPRLVLDLVTTMGLIGLVLTLVGLYGVVAYNVSRRTREVGIRMAIGAGRGDVLTLVMRQGLLLVAGGTALGLILSFGAEQLLDSMFVGAGIDPIAYLIVVPALFVITMLAAFVPAYRASRIEPTLALRYE